MELAMALIISWGIEAGGSGWGAGGQSFGIFSSEEECLLAIPSVFDKYPNASVVRCLKIKGDSPGNGDVIDRISFDRGMTRIEDQQ